MPTIADIENRISACRDLIQQKIGQRDALVSQRNAAQTLRDASAATLETYSSVRRLLEVFTKGTEIKIRQYIEPIITEALDFVFDQGLQFHLVFVNRRNQMEVDFFILRDEKSEEEFQKYIMDQVAYEKQLEQLVKETKNISDTLGGAVNQVLSCALRFVIAELLKIQGPIFLDEPSSAVHPTYAARLGQLISSLSERFHRQYIVVTHSKELASYADKIYEVSQINGISNITEIMD